MRNVCDVYINALEAKDEDKMKTAPG